VGSPTSDKMPCAMCVRTRQDDDVLLFLKFDETPRPSVMARAFQAPLLSLSR
jgi:hypothetical protein